MSRAAPPKVSADQAVAAVRSGHRVFVQGAAATPHHLLAALAKRSAELSDVELVHLHTEGDDPTLAPAHRDAFRTRALFLGPAARAAFYEADVDYVPIYLGDVPALFRSGELPIDVALVHVSPPDAHGFCSLGVSVDVARAATDAARVIVAQVNPKMPRTHGDGLLHASRIDAFVEIDEPLPETASKPASETELVIARQVASLIEDGSTLEVGIGAIPDAVLAALRGRKHLGVHTEMFSDGLVDLFASGAIDGSRKAIHKGQIVASFVNGSRKTYDFVHDNPEVILLDTAVVNDVYNIAKNPKVAAINGAIEIDLTGQVCADSIGCRPFSGTGGQVDFLRGAALSPGGRPIVAMRSTTHDGASRIVPTLQTGAGVVTSRAQVHWVVTEHGAVNLHGKGIRERAALLTGIAHPAHRDALAAKFRELYGKRG
jgi:4-hydroxybutyrate CoA-transferase